MATGFRAIILAGLAIGGVGGVVVPDFKLNDAVAIQDRGEQALSALYLPSVRRLAEFGVRCR